jgi:hypothetical protein
VKTKITLGAIIQGIAQVMADPTGPAGGELEDIAGLELHMIGDCVAPWNGLAATNEVVEVALGV